MPFGMSGPRPARPGGGPDAEGAELVEREHPVQEPFQDVLDTVQLGVTLGVRRFLPGLGVLEGDAVAGQQPP
jgi:hypothetical protein